MSRVALVETKKSRTNYENYFEQAFEFDRYALCSDPTVKKVLKRDADIEIDIDSYDWIILIGSEALKFFTKTNSVTEHSGRIVDEKFLPIINPAMLAFKPEATKTWDTSRQNIIEYISGTKIDTVVDDSIAFGIEDTGEAIAFLTEALEHPGKFIALDCETSALYPRDGYILGLSLCFDGQRGAYINSDCLDDEAEALMKELFSKKRVIFHNAKFDIAFFEYHFDVYFDKFEDTMLLHYLIDENPGGHGLKQLALKYTPYGDYEKPMYEWMDAYRKRTGTLKADFTWDLIPFDMMKTYAAMDSLVTFQLYEKFKRILDNSKLKAVYTNILIPGTRFLTNMQDNGVPFDMHRLTVGQKLMQTDIDAAVAILEKNNSIQHFEKIQGKEFNPNSTVQLRKLLFDFVGLQPTGKKTGTGNDSTDAEVLGDLSRQSEIPGLILNIRQKSKIKNTYLDKIIPQLDTDGCLRTGFNLHTTTSGRLSSSGKLNMQQIPRDNPIIKGCIKAKEGYKIVAMDLTTAEVYVAAILAEDQALMDVFRMGGNFHSAIAHKVFRLKCSPDEVLELFPTERQAAKAVTFGIMYGAGAPKISQEITKSSGVYFSPSEAQEVIDDYFKSFHKLKSWIEKNKTFIEANGFVYSFFGRKRRLPNVASKDKGIKSHSIRSGLNFLVQSTASDINLLGAIEMEDHIRRTGMGAKIFALVHDSVLAQVPVDEVEDYIAILQDFIQKDRGISIPGVAVGCDFEVGEDYSMGKFIDKYGEYL
jgi:DNA polymerase I-like protein with 3'-5' exonuclease and polymerase domains